MTAQRVGLLVAAAGLVVACSGPGKSAPPVTPTSQASNQPVVVTTPDCRSQLLAAGFHGGGLGTGSDFGRIDVYNLGPHPCLASGSVSVQAVGQHGQVLATMHANARPITLTGHAVDFSGQEPSGEVIMEVIVAGAWSWNGNGCAADQRVTPATWRLRLAGHWFAVRNYDPSHLGQQGLMTEVSACQGHFDTLDVTSLS